MAKEARASETTEAPAAVEADKVPAAGDNQAGPRGAVQNRGAVKAVCPRNADHPGARVHTTKGRVRHCVCDTCGEQWKISGPYADPLRDYVLEYCDSVDEGIQHATEVNGKPCVLLPIDAAKKLVRRLRELVIG